MLRPSCGGSQGDDFVDAIEPTQQPSTTSVQLIQEAYTARVFPLSSEYAEAIQSLVDWQDHTYPQMIQKFNSPQTTLTEIEEFISQQVSVVDETYKAIRDIPQVWAAINPPGNLAEFHSLWLESVLVRLEALQKWLGGVGMISVDTEEANRLIQEGDALVNQSEDLMFQAISIGAREGLPFGP